jgi:hypothetical protein
MNGVMTSHVGCRYQPTLWVALWACAHPCKLTLLAYSFGAKVSFSPNVATLTLGSRPRQGVTRLQAKRETWESLHMLLGVQRVWRNEPSHSEVNSHVGSWSPEWTLKSSERDCRGQNSLPQTILCVIKNLLKCKCLKWARIAHLDIWNTSYGQKKGRKSNWQFDSRPLKIRNQPNFLACRQRVTYRWKALNKGYNFSLDLITVGGLHKKLCAFKVAGVPVVAISRLPLGSPETKNHLDVVPIERRKVYYKGEGGGFPQVWAVVNLVCLSCPWFILAPKVLQLRTNHFVLVLCRSVWVNKLVTSS